ncbi:MAG TPA: hypothetical protein VNA65_08255 [Candidatus Dormibacteraeota bacterium]|nr:hypothetical protein [Candidatus Dormibacteraeota bacterium]
MRVSTVQRETLAVSLFLALAILSLTAVSGFRGSGAGIAVGLVIGSLNGFVIQKLLDRRAPMLPTSVLRIGAFSLLALIIARAGGWWIWTVVAGLALAQLTMFVVGVRHGLRA